MNLLIRESLDDSRHSLELITVQFVPAAPLCVATAVPVSQVDRACPVPQAVWSVTVFPLTVCWFQGGVESRWS